MAHTTVTVDLGELVTTDQIIDAFADFGNVISTAINIHHAKAVRLEALGISAGRFQREVLEELAETISALLPNA